MTSRFLYTILLTIATTAGFATSANTSPCALYDTLQLPQCGKKVTLSSIDTLHDDCLIGRQLLRYKPYVEETSASCSAAVSLMDKRYATFGDRRSFKIDYSEVEWLGDSTAPVSVLMYVAMSCPHCKQVYKQLYDTLYMNPSLRKTMRLGIKYRSQTKYDKILRATATMQIQPAFLRRCADISERIDDAAIKKIAAMVKINSDSLMHLAELDNNILAVKASNREAIDNEVEFTPAIFINNRRYHSTKNAHWILDAVDYFAAEKLKGTAKK